jgi:hypothetical protein
MTWTGRYFWVGEESGQIYQLDTNMTLVRWIPSPSPGSSNPRGLAFDGKDLWVGAQTVGLIFRIDTITGAIQEQFTAPSRGLQQGLTWDGRYLWSTGGNNWVYKIDVRVNIEERLADRLEARTGLRLEIWPNPCRGRLNCRIVTKSARPAELKVQFLDVGGRPVRTLEKSSAVLHLAPGVYFLKLEASGQSATRKLVVVN